MSPTLFKGCAEVKVASKNNAGALVTSSATATALSNRSCKHANNLARKIAKKQAIKILKRQICLSNQTNENNMGNDVINELHCTYYSNIIEPFATTTTVKAYTPSQIRKAYTVPTILPYTNVRKPIIAIVIAYHYANLQKDFNAFCIQNNLPALTLQIEDLGKGATNSTSIKSGWAVEECLDVQWSYAMNTNAIIRVVAAKSASFGDMFYAVKYASTTSTYGQLPDIISMSWGSREFSTQNQYNTNFSNSNICYLAASGDSNNVSYPSSSPNVLACGGTSLKLDLNNLRSSETTWSSAGCGVSAYCTKPVYQQNITTISKYHKRCLPDVSCIANPNTGVGVCYNGNTMLIGGTSLSTPVFSGILSLGIQNRLNNKKQSITTVPSTSRQTNLLQNLLYKTIYNNGSNTIIYSNNFYDIKLGTNGTPQTGGIYVSSNNFDVATGLGAPKATALVQSITTY